MRLAQAKNPMHIDHRAKGRGGSWAALPLGAWPLESNSPAPETRNPKTEIRNPEPGTHNCPCHWQFVPLPLLGRIVDNLTFAVNFLKMRQKDMKEAKEQAKKQSQPASENSGGMDINTDENMGGTTHLNEPVAEETEVEKLKAELEEYKDKLLRKIAEFDNFRKRSSKERVDFIQTAGREVIVDMLDVLDDAIRAEKQMASTEDIEQLREGVSLVFNKLRNTLSAKGLKAMETLHQDFDPDKHEAVTEVPAPSEELKGKILDEIVKGYTLNNKIIRHPKVVVGK